MSLDAFVEDLKFGLKHFEHFDRKAVVSDKRWHAAIARVVDKLVPTVLVRHFSPSEVAEAKAWVSAPPGRSDAASGSSVAAR